ncbi:MAG: cytochrome c-type biogenesis protein [Rubricella sp.]
MSFEISPPEAARRLIAGVLVMLMALAASPAQAVQPDEILDDPALEERARDISEGLRCLVCQNESIDLSNAELARDLRLLVRERLVAGDSDEEVVSFIVDRYGEYVLLRPRFNAGNAILWLAGPILLVFGGILAAGVIRRRPDAATVEAPSLTEEERARLDRLMRDGDGV